MPPTFPPREDLGPNRVLYRCSICHRALWPDETVRARQADPAHRRWDGLVFCPEHAAERGIT